MWETWKARSAVAVPAKQEEIPTLYFQHQESCLDSGRKSRQTSVSAVNQHQHQLIHCSYKESPPLYNCTVVLMVIEMEQQSEHIHVFTDFRLVLIKS